MHRQLLNWPLPNGPCVPQVLLPAPLPKPPSPPGQSLYTLLGNDPTFATLRLLVDVASAGAINFTALLSNTSQPLTLFAPTNDVRARSAQHCAPRHLSALVLIWA